MNIVMSTLFQVIFFLHDGKIVTIDQLSFLGPELTSNHPNSLNVPNMQMVSSSPQVNYVETCPMPNPIDE